MVLVDAKFISIFILLVLIPSAYALTIPVKLGPLSVGGDADDPAIWIHPTVRAKSLMFLSDKRTGIYVYNYTGQMIQHVTVGSGTNKLNNLDVRTGLTCGDHQIDILAGNLRDAGKLAVFKINPNYGSGISPLTVLSNETFSNNNINPDSYLFALYKRLSDGKMFVFDKNSGSGSIKEWRIDCSQSEQITVVNVRTINDVSMAISEGAVADDELGYVYFAEETKGIHKYNADPASANLNRLSLFATGDGTQSDREGLALYKCNNGAGYLFLSSQGNSLFMIYNRQNNSYLKTFSAQGASGTDSIDVSAYAVSGFPNGFLIIHSGGAYYNVYDWADLVENNMVTCIDGGATVCNNGQTQSCNTGLLGVCAAGTQTCTNNQWGQCIQNVFPSAEICGNGIDEDCNGSDLACNYDPADTNHDGCISLGEISAYVTLWLQGQITLGQISSSVAVWLQGC